MTRGGRWPAPTHDGHDRRPRRRRDGGVLRGVRPDARRRRPVRARSTAASSCGSSPAPTPPAGRARRRRPTTPTTSAGSRPTSASRGRRRAASGASLVPRSSRDRHSGSYVRRRRPPRAARIRRRRPPTTDPGASTARTTARRRGSCGQSRVRPRKLGHVVLGSTDYRGQPALLRRRHRLQGQRPVDGLARSCAARPTTTTCSCSRRRCRSCTTPSWQVDDVDEVGRGAHALLEGRPGAARLGSRPPLTSGRTSSGT